MAAFWVPSCVGGGSEARARTGRLSDNRTAGQPDSRTTGQADGQTGRLSDSQTARHNQNAQQSRIAQPIPTQLRRVATKTRSSSAATPAAPTRAGRPARPRRTVRSSAGQGSTATRTGQQQHARRTATRSSVPCRTVRHRRQAACQPRKTSHASRARRPCKRGIDKRFALWYNRDR